MGHTISTYHDIQMKGTEFLRNIYIASGFSIKPRTRLSKIDALKEIIRAWGLSRRNPHQTSPNRTAQNRNRQTVARRNTDPHLSLALKQQLLKELREDPDENQKLYKFNSRIRYFPGYHNPKSGRLSNSRFSWSILNAFCPNVISALIAPIKRVR